MKLHEFSNEFQELITIVAAQKGLPESAVERDYYIVLLLDNLAQSEYADQCVFKGGTSLSKCYPGSIERFSEDIDLTFLGTPEMTNKAYGKKIKKIEAALTIGAETEPIVEERNDRNKSMFVWFGNKANRVKLEIGSSVRPDPFSPKVIKSYIHEFLEELHAVEDIHRYELDAVILNVLNIERTFIDKVMSVKRHAICGTLSGKVRHIYDVVRLFDLPEIQEFLADEVELKRLVQLTKATDSFYLEKRNISKDYDPTGPYDFAKWESFLDSQIQSNYEKLHEDLLFTNEKQDFEKALSTFKSISAILASIDE